jgi:hypothetical protein
MNVSHTPLDKNGRVTVHFERPDSSFGIKTLDCTIPEYKVSNVVGFSDIETFALIHFCRCNAPLILEVAPQGGLENAKFI